MRPPRIAHAGRACRCRHHLQDAGEAAVDTLIYIAENPVASAKAVRDAAIEGLATIADG